MSRSVGEPAEAASFAGALRNHGVRVTTQRLLVLEALAALGGHTTADEILRWASARQPAINLATVYRTLELLMSIGMVAQTDLGGSATSFELVGETPHHHLVCERCGAVLELDDAALQGVREALLRDYGFDVTSRHIAIFGMCRGCRERAAPFRGPTPAREPSV